MKYLLLSVILATSLIISCNSGNRNKPGRDFEKLITASSWYQHSAEMNALYYQGFNIARERVETELQKPGNGKPLAVVVDIDETMLDNSPYETELIKNGESKDGWHKWTEKASARALPGALDFAKFAEGKQVAVFYVTNRDSSERESTLRNLAKLGFPYADQEHLLTRGDTSFANGNVSSKAGRRAKVASTHNIILLIGDNLNDFSEIFENRKTNMGKDAVAENAALFGKRYIILPNPMYGAWEKPLFDYQDKLSEREKTQLMVEKLLDK